MLKHDDYIKENNPYCSIKERFVNVKLKGQLKRDVRSKVSLWGGGLKSTSMAEAATTWSSISPLYLFVGYHE